MNRDRTIMNLHRPPSIWIPLIILLAAPSLSFGSLLPPPSLDPGDTYRVVFVTSQETTASSSDISYYNGFVNSVANNLGGFTGSVLASLGTTWTVLGSTDTVNAFNNIGGTFSDNVYLPNGTLVAAGSSGLWSGSLLHAISLDETGTTGTAFIAWTGSYTDGTANIPLGSSTAIGGSPNQTNYQWANYGNYGTSNTFSLYGISGQLTVPGSVPEPSTLVTMAGGAVLLGLAERRRRTRHARSNLQS